MRQSFVDVPLGPVWDDAQSSSTRVPGVTWGSGFAFGFDSGRSGVEFDVGVPQWHVKNNPTQRYLLRRAILRMVATGPLLRVVVDGASPLDRPDGLLSRQRAGQSTRHGHLARRRRLRVSTRAVHQRDEGGAARWTADRGEYDREQVLPQLPGGGRKTRRRAQSRATRICRAPSAAHGISIAARRSGSAPRVIVARPEIAVRWGF